MDDMKKKIYRDLRNEADMCMQGKLENFICDLQEDGSELGNANELTPESLENYMYSVLSKAMALWKSPITKPFGDSLPSGAEFVEKSGLSNIFILHALCMAFKYLAEFKPSSSGAEVEGGRLPKCVGYCPQTDLKCWSLSISNFIISVMYKEIGWDVKKYPTIAAREKAYRNESGASKIEKFDKNEIAAALRKEDRAYNFVYLETDRFRKYLNEMFADYDFYQAKRLSESVLRFKPMDDSVRAEYLARTQKKKLSSAEEARKEPRVIPYSDWFLYAVHYLDSSRKLADLTSKNLSGDNFGSLPTREILRAKRLYRLIQECDSNYTDSDIKYQMKELHSRRYLRKADENRRFTSNEKKLEKQIADFNEKIVDTYCPYIGYGKYRFIQIAENCIPNSSHWRYPRKVIPLTEKLNDAEFDVLECFEYVVSCWLFSKKSSPEKYIDLVDLMKIILFHYGYGELFNRIKNLPQPDGYLSYKIYTELFVRPLAYSDCSGDRGDGVEHRPMTITDVFNLSDENIKAKLEILNQWFTEWCGRFFNVYAYYMVTELMEKDLSPELLDDTMVLVLKKLFEEYEEYKKTQDK